MQYANSGETVRVEDEVDMDGTRGTVVFSIDTDEYGSTYPQAAWAYLGRGIGVLTPRLGLVHLKDNSGLVLIFRPSAT